MIARRIFIRVSALALAGTALKTGTASAQPTVMERGVTIEAIVETVDHQTRTVLLRGPDGLRTLKVGPEVRNFAQLRSGDRVRIAYLRAVAVEVVAPGAPPAPPSRDLVATRVAPGQRPGAAAADAVRFRVRVEGVDREGGEVWFTAPDRTMRHARVQAPAMRDVVRRLKAGDEVELAFIEAVAIEVLPARN